MSGFVEALRQLYTAERQALFTYALAVTGERRAAEDAVHAAFCSLLARGRAPAELRPYVFRCVRNAALDALRLRDRAALHPGIYNGRTDVDPALRLEAEEALAALSSDERETVVLKIYSGLTFQEIAALREVSINTAASWYRRGIERMRALHAEDARHERS